MRPAGPIGFAQFHAMPLTPEPFMVAAELLGLFVVGDQRGEQIPELMTHGDQTPHIGQQIPVAVMIRPDHPAQRAVLTPGVVVASLAAAYFITH